jgi:hypothetical protein
MRRIANWSNVARAVGAVVFWLPFTGMAGWFVTAGAWDLMRGSAGEHAQRCASGEAGRCFTYTPGIVSDPDEGDVRVRTDEGLIEIALRGSASPSEGTRVLVERWDGAVVAVVDRGSERRYRTFDWPQSLDAGAIVGVVIGLAMLSLPVRRAYRLLRQLRGAVWT